MTIRELINSGIVSINQKIAIVDRNHLVGFGYKFDHIIFQHLDRTVTSFEWREGHIITHVI